MVATRKVVLDIQPVFWTEFDKAQLDTKPCTFFFFVLPQRKNDELRNAHVNTMFCRLRHSEAARQPARGPIFGQFRSVLVFCLLPTPFSLPPSESGCFFMFFLWWDPSPIFFLGAAPPSSVTWHTSLGILQTCSDFVVLSWGRLKKYKPRSLVAVFFAQTVKPNLTRHHLKDSKSRGLEV